MGKKTAVLAAIVAGFVGTYGAAQAWPQLLLHGRAPEGAVLVSEATGASAAWQFDATGSGHTGQLASFKRSGTEKAGIANDGAVRPGSVPFASLRSGCANGELVWDSTLLGHRFCRSSSWLPLDTNTTYSVGAGLAATGTVFRVQDCASGKVLRAGASNTWTCGDAPTIDTNTTYSAGAGIDMSSNSISLANCSDGEHWVTDKGSLICESTSGPWRGRCKVQVTTTLNPNDCEYAVACPASGVTPTALVLATINESMDEPLFLQRAWAGTDEVYFRLCNASVDATVSVQDAFVAWQALRP